MEYWDLYDENRKPLGKTHMRGERLSQGEFHIVVEVWTVNKKREVLTTLRDPNKESYPNKWENTGGSILTGEHSRQGAIRELYEETGITAAEDELVFLGTDTERSAFVDIYFLHKDIQIEHLTMQEGETVAAKWVSLEELHDMIDNGDLALPTGERFRYVAEEFNANISKINNC